MSHERNTVDDFILLHTKVVTWLLAIPCTLILLHFSVTLVRALVQTVSR